MVALDEIAKINTLIASCNDIINGKFILADYKIANILKNITDSKEVYNLLANSLNNFDFDREFSRAKFHSSSQDKFVLPEEKEKILPFVFCVLFNINNKSINFDNFLKKYYKSETNNHGEEFAKFANEVILPFKNLIAENFELDKNIQSTQIPEQVESVKGEEMEEVEFFEDENEDLNYPELTADKVEQFLLEVKSICTEIINEIHYDKRTKQDLKDNIEYLSNAIILNCENQDLKNAVALIIAFDYVIQNVKVLKFLSKELKKLLINFYEE